MFVVKDPDAVERPCGGIAVGKNGRSCAEVGAELINQQSQVADKANFAWWPTPTKPNRSDKSRIRTPKNKSPLRIRRKSRPMGRKPLAASIAL